MSKSTKSTQKSVKKTENKEKKPVKGIIIAVAAVILAVAIAVTAVFIVKRSKDDVGNELTTVPIVTLKNEGSQYTYAEYKESSLPVEFVEILNQAAIDSAAACEKYGVALTLGERNISMSEFVMYYYDQYHLQLQEIAYSYEKEGTNRTGYDTKVLPDKQKYLNQDYTWAEDFTRKAINEMTYIYEGFDMAIKEGTKLNVLEISETISYYERVDQHARSQKRDADEIMAETYCEGMTAAIFKAREIMQAYTSKYETEKRIELAKSYSQEDLEKKFNEDKHEYTVVYGRVYPIEGQYKPEEVSKVSTEQEFLDFAKANHPNESYNAEIRTQCYFVDRESVSSTYGNEVGEWMFSDDRVPGEIAVISGALFDYLVYVERPAFLGTSRQVMIYQNDFSSGATAEQMSQIQEETQNVFDEWKAGGATEESFKKLCEKNGDEAVRTVRTDDCHFMLSNWIFDSSRKAGDYEIINSDVGSCIVYYLGNNTEDYDWIEKVRTDKRNEDYQSLYNETVEKNYKVKRDESIINVAQQKSNVLIEDNMNKLDFE